jgi:hypothetical protein
MRIWLLGAADPEIEHIESLLRAAGETVAYASIRGARVRPENAYDREYIHAIGRDGLPVQVADYDTLALVECDHPQDGLGHRMVFDHHRPGDPGHAMPPAVFLPASSLGQVIVHLATTGRLLSHWPTRTTTFPARVFFDNGWWVCCEQHRGWTNTYTYARVPDDLVHAAAADHCLAAAYRGLCPGVDPDRLMRWRIETRAALQQRSVEELLSDVEAARLALRTAPHICLACGCGSNQAAIASNCSHGSTWVADLRGRHVPELPEAAARNGVAFVGTPLSKPGGPQQVVLQCASPEQLAAWPGWAASQGLVDLCGGDPALGFAGGYVPSSTSRSKGKAATRPRRRPTPKQFTWRDS